VELEKQAPPDIIAGSWLKNASTGIQFRVIDNFFGVNKLSRAVFNYNLLAAGRIERHQYLLPVSYNVPAIIFSRDKDLETSNPFTIDFEEIKTLSKNYNIESRGNYTRMGFSPIWNENFLFITAVLFDSSFREASPLIWDSAALDRAMNFIYTWTREVNSSNQAEDDFTFKYFYEPPAKLVQSGRILFSYLESNVLFTLNEENRYNLDFRWISENNKIPMTEDIVYLGLTKKRKSTKAAEAFIYWFFTIETQQMLLENKKTNRINESVFGICGGFSALSLVTEQVFPRFYPDLLGRMPPSDYLIPPNNLPNNWFSIKDRVILPYLNDRARVDQSGKVQPPLERRITDWMRINR
jgi:hypothetical protein